MRLGTGFTPVALLVVASMIRAATVQDWRIECIECPREMEYMTERSLGLDSDGIPHIAYGGDHLYHAWLSGASWEHEIVDPSSGVGADASIAIDGQGDPHIAYYDELDNALMYAHRSDDTWFRETVATGSPDEDMGRCTSLVLDASGAPHIGYLGTSGSSAYGVMYATKEQSGWRFEVVEGTDFCGDLSLQLDGTDRPHMAFQNWSNASLMYAHRPDQSWHVEFADSGGGTGACVSLKLDNAGVPHVSYFDWDSGSDLHYAFRNENGWHAEIVESENQVGLYSSLVVDSSGYPHISYVHAQSNELRYAYKDESGWQIETTNTLGPIDYFTSLVLDHNEEPHIATVEEMTDVELTYLFRASGAWERHVVDNGASAGKSNSLAVGLAGYPSIGYRKDSGSDDLRFAYRDDAGWHMETLMSDVYLSYSISLAHDELGIPHLSFTNSGNLEYAFRDASGWQIEAVDSEGQMNRTSIKISYDGFPHIASHDILWEDLKYAYKDAAGWHLELVDTLGLVGEHPSLELSSSGYARISYQHYGHGDLRYAADGPGGWQIDTVDHEGRTGEYTSLALDDAEHPHISYYDWINKDLRYATNAGAGWRKETVDADGDVGRYTSVIVDSEGIPHISYYDGSSGDLKYAFKTPLGWVIQTVDDEGIVGAPSSIGLTEDGLIWISYYDVTDEDLKLATTAATASMRLFGQIIGGQLLLSWTPVIGVLHYRIYGAENLPFFPPGESFPYEYRIDEVLYGTTSWVSTYPLGDPANNWTYLVIALDQSDQEITRSNRVGEWDWEMEVP